MSRIRDIVKIIDVNVSGTHALLIPYTIREEREFAITLAQVATAAINVGVKQCDKAFVYFTEESHVDPYVIEGIEDISELEEYMVDAIGATEILNGEIVL